MKKVPIAVILFVLSTSLAGQVSKYPAFQDRWVIHTPSAEVLPQYKMDARIAHRFGDIAGDAGGWSTFYGLENAADISIGVEYGLLSNLTLGFARAKAAGPLKQLLNFYGKYQMYGQSKAMPVALSAFALSSFSTQAKSEDPASVNYFEKFAHRFSYYLSLIAARKFSDGFSTQIAIGLSHRNTVPFGEENNILQIGSASKIQLTKVIGLIADISVPLNGRQSPFVEDPPTDSYYVPLGIGLEFDTGGHQFQLNFTNASGIMPTDYIPYNRSNWLDGQFRLGFTISRQFNL